MSEHGKSPTPEGIAMSATYEAAIERLITRQFPENIHVEIVQPDERLRFRLGRWASRDPQIAGWKVFVSNNGRTIRLEALDGEG